MLSCLGCALIRKLLLIAHVDLLYEIASSTLKQVAR